jgi:hypothetical protein
MDSEGNLRCSNRSCSHKASYTQNANTCHLSSSAIMFCILYEGITLWQNRRSWVLLSVYDPYTFRFGSIVFLFIPLWVQSSLYAIFMCFSNNFFHASPKVILYMSLLYVTILLYWKRWFCNISCILMLLVIDITKVLKILYILLCYLNIVCVPSSTAVHDMFKVLAYKHKSESVTQNDTTWF